MGPLRLITINPERSKNKCFVNVLEWLQRLHCNNKVYNYISTCCHGDGLLNTLVNILLTLNLRVPAVFDKIVALLSQI